ncbi:MAG: hypothetical protein WA324_04595 [Bryobacteraceae bacterium]
MSKRTLWVSIESITLIENGDVPGQRPPTDPRNAVVATLTYPRSGAPTVSSGQPYNIPQNSSYRPNQADFFVSGLFKEVVQDQTILEIKVTDTDKASKAEKIFFTVLGTLVSAGLTAATGGLTGFLGAISGIGVTQIYTGMGKLGQDQVYVMGATGKIPIDVDAISGNKEDPTVQTYPLTVPADVEKGYLVLGPDNQTQTKYLKVPKGTKNGSITLRLYALPD